MPEAVAIRELEPAARFVLQGGAGVRLAAGGACGLMLPDTPCRAQESNGRAALWLGPEEHLLLAPASEAGALYAKVAGALAGKPHSLVDVSHRQVAIAVTGAKAGDLVNTGCPLDLDLAEFPPGSCTRTLLGKVEIVLWRRAPEEYQLEVWRSFAGYVLGWLREAVRSEFAES